MVSTDSIDLVYICAKCHGLVNDKLNEIVWCGFSCQETELPVDSMYPCDNDACGDLGGAVNPRNVAVINTYQKTTDRV